MQDLFPEHDDAVSASLDKNGFAIINSLLSSEECKYIANFYDAPNIKFRARIDMARYNFGQGEYQYFDYPLPDIISTLREKTYAKLAPIANSWHEKLGIDSRWPEQLQTLLQLCHKQGQTRPTPLLLKYGPGDYNCLHQDLYGDIHFPLQVIIMLSKPVTDFQGGELLLVEQRPRMQSRGRVIPIQQGDAVVIPVRERPRRGTRGYHRAVLRHGVSQLLAGERYTLGLIFHDAR